MRELVPGLAAGREPLEHDDLEPFRGCIDCGPEPGGARSDDRHVVKAFRGHRHRCAQAFADRLDGGIAQHAPIAQHDRRLVRTHVELLEQAFHVVRVLEIEVFVRRAVARQKIAKLHGLGRIARADERHGPDVLRDHAHATQYESLHEQLAELRVDRHQLAQPLLRHCDHAKVAARTAADERCPSSHRRRFAGKLTRLKSGDDALAMYIAPHDVDRPFEHDIERHAAVAGLPQPFPVAETFFRAGATQDVELGSSQRRKQLVRTRFGAGSPRRGCFIGRGRQ